LVRVVNTEEKRTLKQGTGNYCTFGHGHVEALYITGEKCRFAKSIRQLEWADKPLDDDRHKLFLN